MSADIIPLTETCPECGGGGRYLCVDSFISMDSFHLVKDCTRCHKTGKAIREDLLERAAEVRWNARKAAAIERTVAAECLDMATRVRTRQAGKGELGGGT